MKLKIYIALKQNGTVLILARDRASAVVQATAKGLRLVGGEQ